MRLRVFSGRSVHEAMAALRQALNDDAVILGTEESADGVHVTAGIETDPDDLGAILETATPLAVIERLALVLRFHVAGGRRIERLCLAARGSGAGDLEKVLAFALAEHYRFMPLEAKPQGTLLLAGAPGVGKSLTIARLAAAARLAGRPVRVATTDTERKGGQAQLVELLRVIGIALEDIQTMRDERPDNAGTGLTLIDTAAVNPLRQGDLATVAGLARRLGGELVPVLPADLMPLEAHDQATAWRALGARRFLATRLDTVRRLGMLLATADAGLAFAGASIAPLVAEPVKPLTAGNLARLFVHRAQAFDAEAGQ